MGDAGALLVRAGLIRAEALETARQSRSSAGGTLAEHLVLGGAVDDETLTRFFRRRLLVPRISNSKLASLPETIIATLPADMASELRVIPVAVDGDGNLTVAMSDPSDTELVDEIGFFTDHYVVRAVASQRQIAWGLANYYGIMTPLAEAMLEAERDAPTDPASTEPYLKAPKQDTRGKKRERSLSIQVAAARHPVIAPTTRPPLEASRPSEATREDFEEALESARPAGTPAQATTVRESAPPTIEDDTPPFVESLPEHLRSQLEGPPPDEASISGVIDAVEPPAPYESSGEITIEIADQAIELDADFAEEDELEIEVTAPLADGSPPELAPRAGELVVGRPKHHSVGARTPAVVLDETLTEPATAAPVAPPEAIEIETDAFDDDYYYDYEDDGEEPAVPEADERGTRSAPILLDQPAEARGEGESPLVTVPLEPAAEGEEVVLLQTPKPRVKRTTEVGLGLEPVEAPTRSASTPPPEPTDAAAVLLDSLEGLQRALDRDQVVAAVLDYFEHFCGKLVFFALRGGVLEVWQTRGVERSEASDRASLSVGKVSTLREIVETRLPYQGPISDPASRELLAAVFGSVAKVGFAMPLAVRGRVVGLLYAEHINGALTSDNVALISRAAGRALERVLRAKPRR